MAYSPRAMCRLQFYQMLNALCIAGFYNYAGLTIFQMHFSFLNLEIDASHELKWLLSLLPQHHDLWSWKALFSSPQKTKTFQDFSSHRILQHIHGALNIDKK